jgi:RNA recognition motif-containing protein
MYETQEQAKVAMTDLIKQGFQVSFAKESFSARLKNLQDSGSTNIYMSNIPMNYTEEGLTELFAPLNVLSQKILRDSSGVSRGVGFIRWVPWNHVMSHLLMAFLMNLNQL